MALTLPPKHSVLATPTYDLQAAADALLALVRAYRQRLPEARVALPASEVRPICPDLPRGELDPGGPSWQSLVTEFAQAGYSLSFHEAHPCSGGCDTVSLS